MVRFDRSDWEWANMLVGRNYRPDRLPKPVIDAECRLLGDKRTCRQHGWYFSYCRVGPGNFTPGTGSPEAVTRLRLPQNVACGFPALRSSERVSQHSECLELPVWTAQAWSL